MSEATVAPAPGMTPTTKPSSEPRSSVNLVSAKSRACGQKRFSFWYWTMPPVPETCSPV
jgi:hypothetical protein